MLEPGRARTRQRTSPHFCHLPHQFSPTSPPIMLLAARLSPGSQTQLVQSNRGGAQDFTVPLFPLLLPPSSSSRSHPLRRLFFLLLVQFLFLLECWLRARLVRALFARVCVFSQESTKIFKSSTYPDPSFSVFSFSLSHTHITVDRSEKHEHKRVHKHKEGRPHPNILSLPSKLMLMFLEIILDTTF